MTQCLMPLSSGSMCVCAWSCCRRLRSRSPHIPGLQWRRQRLSSSPSAAVHPEACAEEQRVPVPTRRHLHRPRWPAMVGCVRGRGAGVKPHEDSSQLTLPEQHLAATRIAMCSTLLVRRAAGVSRRTLHTARATSSTWAPWGRRRRTPASRRHAHAGSVARRPPRFPTACRCGRRPRHCKAAELATPPSSTAPDQRVLWWRPCCASGLLTPCTREGNEMEPAAGAPAARAAGRGKQLVLPQVQDAPAGGAICTSSATWENARLLRYPLPASTGCSMSRVQASLAWVNNVLSVQRRRRPRSWTCGRCRRCWWCT